MIPHRPFILLALVSALALSGCRVDTHKHGDNTDVDIGIPFGTMHVKTDEHASGTTGLTPYPGAAVVHKNGHDSGPADVNMNFGSFKLGVHTVEFHTADDQDKVLAFYKKDMGRYGAVLTCRGKEAVGIPVRTGEGLTCGTENSSSDGELQLRAGSDVHQHIVAIRSEDGGTHIGLVALDLPRGIHGSHDSSDRE